MSFHNVRLPEDIEKGAEGGPGFNTTVLKLSSGYERRNINWERELGEWDIAYGIQHKEDLDAVMNFFYVRRGKAYGFRFKDWSDFEIGATGSPHTIATGDGATAAHQVYKTYTDAGGTFQRKITRLDPDFPIQVYVDGVLKTLTTHYTVDYDTGIITFTGGNIPTLGQVIAVIAWFDVPVRFDIDKLRVRMEWEDAMEIPNIPIVGIKE
jgi:uncharacterized protein (TIGR02217 family)